MFFFHSAFTIINEPIEASKTHPSAIDKWAMVFVPPLTCEEKKNRGILFTQLRNLKMCAAAFIASFTSEE
jgi:hypothetical protein